MATRRKGWLAWLLLITVVGASAAPVWADEMACCQNGGPLRKLGRGLANVATCPFELLRTPELVGRKDGYIAAMSVGILKGAWNTLVRATAGVYEVVTFYAEYPKGYRPLVKPEFVWAHGNWAE